MCLKSTDIRARACLFTLFSCADMIDRGYEWAAKYGEPANKPPKRYRFQPKWCAMRAVPQGSVLMAFRGHHGDERR